MMISKGVMDVGRVVIPRKTEKVFGAALVAPGRKSNN